MSEELIKKSDAVKAVKAYLDLCCLTEAQFHKEAKDYNEEIAREIFDQITPSIDIVRCKECRYNYNKVLNHGKMQPRCDFTDRKLSEDDYCSRGEREGE